MKRIWEEQSLMRQESRRFYLGRFRVHTAPKQLFLSKNSENFSKFFFKYCYLSNLSILSNFQFCPTFNLSNFQFSILSNFVRFSIFNFVQLSILSNFQFSILSNFQFVQLSILSNFQFSIV